ncbi:MAG: histidine kinase [Spirochaetales bacterium]|nr:histidine kinase [Spirochaetales bacterium]
MNRIQFSNSLKSKLVYYLVLSLGLTVIFFGFILIMSLTLQDVADDRFANEQFLQELKVQLEEVQNPLENYLASFSSVSLGKLLFTTETLKEALPADRPITSNQQDLMQREIFYLIDTYLEKVNLIVEQKRGRKVSEYTSGFEDLSTLYSYIGERIDRISLTGFREQLEEYRGFLVLFRKIQIYSLLLILLTTAFAFSLLTKTMLSISAPMDELSRMAGKISGGDFQVPDVHYKSVNEVNQVAEAFNDMKSSIRHYIHELQKQKAIEQEIMTERVRNLKMEQLLKRMELYTMQAQMNPHFLFNTINTGVQLAIVEEAEKTADFMEHLAALFRYNIREKKFFVPLRHEYEGLLSYFNILKIRFPKSLNLILDINESLLDQFTCPAMVLQPIVENSVLHAFKSREGTGTVSVSISWEDPVIILSVKDDGVGIPREVVENILTPTNHDYQLSSKVMGLENVIQRCYFFYPDQKDVIDIRTAPDKGTEIIIRIHTEVKPCIEL